MRVTYGLGRLIFGAFFLYNGINHFANLDTLEQYAAFKKVPNPRSSVQLSGAVLTAAGASLMLGWKPRLGALGVLGFLAAISPSMHDFWNQQDPTQRQNEMIHLSKNLALFGAAIALLGAESGD